MTQSDSKITAGLTDTGEKIDPEEIKTIVKGLKASFKFGTARKLLAKVIKLSKEEDHFYIWFKQQLALCTYKDEELLPDRRFSDALRILEDIGLRNPETTDAETLALGGAVFKRMWGSPRAAGKPIRGPVLLSRGLRAQSQPGSRVRGHQCRLYFSHSGRPGACFSAAHRKHNRGN